MGSLVFFGSAPLRTLFFSFSVNSAFNQPTGYHAGWTTSLMAVLAKTNSLAKNGKAGLLYPVIRSSGQGIPLGAHVHLDAVKPGIDQQGLELRDEIKVGLVQGRVILPEEVKALATMPSRETLLVQLLTTIQTPASYLLGTILSAFQEFLSVLQARIDQQSQQMAEESSQVN
jgi:hypothetical protein